MSVRYPVIAVVMIVLVLVVGCGGAEATPTSVPPTSTPAPPPASPTPITDPELEAFAAELADINSRLREAIQAAVTAPTEEDVKAAFATLAEIDSDAQSLSVPEDNEVAQELVPYLLHCTDNFHEDMSIDDFIPATQDCLFYFELLEELLEADSSSSE